MFSGAVVVMGVSGCGKSTVGEGIAKHFGIPFIEADKLHPPANIAKMAAGTPLTDGDRWPWLSQVGASLAGNGGKVAACSALKRAYRDLIAETAGRNVVFVYLEGSRALLEERMRHRTGHFMPPSLLASQLATLEEPTADENAVAIDIADTPDIIIGKAVAYLSAHLQA